MDSCDVDPEEGFFFIWTIKNYNYFLHDSLNDYTSPEFELYENSRVQRKIRLHPIPYFRHDKIGISLEKSSSTEDFHLMLEIFISTVKGTYKKIIDKKLTWYNEKNSLFVGDLKINKDDLQDISNDSLTIKCRIWKANDKVLASRKCYARTIIGMDKTTYNCTLEGLGDFENDPRIDKRLLTLSKVPLFTMDLSTTREEFGETNVEIEIKQNQQKTCFSSCEISLIDVNGKIAHSVRDEYRFDFNREQVWTFPFIQVSKLLNNKNLYFSNGILLLRCEFTVSLGVICNRVEKTEYGMSNERHLNSYYARTKSDFTESLKNSLQEKDSDFPGSWKSDLQCFYTEGKFSDFTIRTSKKDFPVHKTILCARSEVFRAMFERDMKESRTGVVEIEDIEEDIVSKMLLFVYTDTIGDDLEWGTASGLYFAADKYGIVALKRKCSDFLVDHFTVTSVCEVLVLADMHRDPELKSAAQDFIYDHTGEIMGSVEWKKLMEKHVQLASETMHSFFRNLKV